MTITGINCEAQIFTDVLDAASEGMIRALCNSHIGKDSIIRIMPDVHAGKGCVIGTTLVTKKKVAPGLLGGDIGCGVTAWKIKVKGGLDLNKLDKVVRAEVPSGMNIHSEAVPCADEIRESLDALKCRRHVQFDKALRSLGTLGGGNHFIELGCENKNEYWLIVHSGSRHLGMETAEFYHKKAFEQHGDVPYDFAYATDELMLDYLHDVKVLQAYAAYNRERILNAIVSAMKWKADSDAASKIDCPHNFIEEITSENGASAVLLRKGAIRAGVGERLLIPMNMRDGCLLCVGKGNADWNCSAPHGAGRLMSRADAKNSFTLTQYKKEMQGIFTTCISRDTIDESPMAYKGIAEIAEKITPTAEIIGAIKPIYNFKAGGE